MMPSQVINYSRIKPCDLHEKREGQVQAEVEQILSFSLFASEVLSTFQA